MSMSSWYSKKPNPKVPSSRPMVGDTCMVSYRTGFPSFIRSRKASVSLAHFNRKCTDERKKRGVGVL